MNNSIINIYIYIIKNYIVYAQFMFLFEEISLRLSELSERSLNN